MAELKTKPTEVPVGEFLDTVPDERRREEGRRLVELFSEVTGEQPVMWGPSIIGFGTMHYSYASGREGDWMRVGFSPRKSALTFYGLREHPIAPALIERLGPHKDGVGCLYVSRLDRVDLEVLRELVRLASS